MLETQIFQVGYLQTNCVLLFDTEGEEAVVVDPGRGFDKIRKYAEKRGKKVVAVLLTHGHWDHVLDAKKWRDCGAKIYIHKDDAEKLTGDWNERGIPSMKIENVEPDVLIKDGDTLEFGKLKFSVIHTAGHSAGSCSFVIDRLILSGDTMFAGCCGRVDFPDGNAAEMRNSLGKLYALEGDYRVIPGHGEETTLETERRNAPFVLGGLY